MRFGIKTNPQDTTWPALLATWRRADEVDAVESAWIFDHFYPIFSDPTGPCFEAWTLLAALARETRRLRIGTMVNGMPYRHPAVTANMAATVDIISDGRLELGLGAGWNQEEAGAYGISLGETIRDRMDMFDEGVEVVVRLLSQEETDFAGKHFRLRAARCEPKGPQRPPPVVIGGGGEKRTLRTAARWANHWNSAPLPAEDWLRKRNVLATHCREVGRDPGEIETSMMFRLGDVGALADQIVAYRDLGLDIAIVNLPSPHEPDHVDVVAAVADSLG